MKKESYLYSRLAGGMVECGTCRRRCVIPETKWGWCRTRVNEGGRLYSEIKEYRLKGNKCPKCGAVIPGKF